MKRVRPEKHKAQYNCKQCERSVQSSGKPALWELLRQVQKLFNNYHAAMQRAPDYKRPVRAMPYACQQPHDRKV